MGVPLQAGPRLPAPETGPDAARALAERILRGDDFDEPERSVWQELAGALAGVFEGLGALLSGASGALAALVAALLAVAAVAALVLVLRRRTGRTRAVPEVRLRSLEGSRPPEAWDAEALDLEARSEWKLALRARYRALVSELIRRGRLRDVPGRTVGEFRAELAASEPVAARPFGQASDLFDRAWYGDEPTGAAERDAFAAHAGDVLQRVRP
jgi:hypothetical protein